MAKIRSALTALTAALVLTSGPASAQTEDER